jgi:hypothetical protein
MGTGSYDRTVRTMSGLTFWEEVIPGGNAAGLFNLEAATLV